MSLVSLLPPPKLLEKHSSNPFTNNLFSGKVLGGVPRPSFELLNPKSTKIREPPCYGSRNGFTPQTVEDYGDGGAFPEIHTLQYPLDMGRKEKIMKQKVAPVQVDDKGNIKYDTVIRQHMRKDQHVYSSYRDLLPKDFEEEDLSKPSPEDVLATAEKTRQALGVLVNAKISASQPTLVRKKKKKKEPIFIRYTPSQQGTAYNSGAKQRIIKVQEMPTDPMEPPKYRHRKLPNAPPSPPAPVMHSPPRKITVQDQQNWKIPPCVSNWKNIKGYAIPLDKRLAADGRGLQEIQINDKFAKLSEALFLAERTARKEIEARATMIRRVMKQQEEFKEAELRKLAEKARKAGANVNEDREEEKFEDAGKETEEQVEARAAREELRKERRRDLKRELRMENMKNDKKANTRAAREAERDISEKIALGQPVPTNRDSMFDQRLFNQDQGLQAGFGANDAYNTYDKPLFKGSAVHNLYRPKKVEEIDSYSDIHKMLEKSTRKFKPDRGFKGTETATAAQPREKPVEFERDEADPFGLGQLLTDARKGRKTLDKIGTQGHMKASAGASRATSAGVYNTTPSRYKEMEFEEGKASTPRGTLHSEKGTSARRKRRRL